MNAQAAVQMTEPESTQSESTQSESTLSNRLSTARTRALFERVFNAPMEISTARIELFTSAYREHADRSMVLRRALANQAVVEQIPIAIHDDELLVGGMSDKRKAALLFPESKSEGIKIDSRFRQFSKKVSSFGLSSIAKVAAQFDVSLRAKVPMVPLLMDKIYDGFELRGSQAFSASEPEKKALVRDVLPYWKSRSAYRTYEGRLSKEEKKLQRVFTYTADPQFMANLYKPDFDKVMRQGLLEAIREAEDRGKAAETDEARDFYRALVISSQSLIAYSERYASEAERLASEASNPERRQELIEIAATLRRVPAHPPASFREALQSYWLLYLGLTLHDGGTEVPFARFDQILAPYYEADISAGTLTEAAARELVEAFVVKANELVFFLENGANLWEDGNTGRLTLTLGGVDAAGNDATTPLSFMLLDIIEAAPLLQPNFAVRLHSAAPEAFVDRVMGVMTGGSNALHVFNDQVIIKGLLDKGYSIEQARDYIIAGCVQPAPADAYGSVCAGFVNLPLTLEQFLGQGQKSYSSFESFLQGYQEHAGHVLEQIFASLQKVDQTHAELLPDSFVSLFIDGPMEQGRDVKNGGAVRNQTGISLVGFATLVDSLAAIRTSVFERDELDLPRLRRMLAHNFEGYEAERLRLLNKAPKFGNDDDAADVLAAQLVDFFAEQIGTYTTYRGGPYTLGFHSEAGHVIYGSAVAASADGRKAGEPLSPGVGPGSGRERNGYTATLRSLSKLDLAKVVGGTSSNLRFHPRFFDSPSQVERFKQLISSYFFDLGGQHLQINVVSSETLRDAQQHPQRYRDLLVRIAGYSARFIDLTTSTQDEIISRTETAER